MSLERAVGLVSALALAGCVGHTDAPAGKGTQEHLVPAVASPLSRCGEVARRVLTPITFRAGQRALAARNLALCEQSVALEQERLSVYVPAGPVPPRGYGLLVYVAPWEAPTEPRRWRRPLDRRGMILAAADRSGNETSTIDRRLPLALLAYENVRARWPVDGDRVFVAGFSGGSRMALMLALAYPDVFRGALLNAGADPIGEGYGIYVPPRELFHRFQRSRLVFATGEHDEAAKQEDHDARASLERWCTFDHVTVPLPRLGHEAIDAVGLDRALTTLEAPPRVDEDRLARCNARLESELRERLAEVEARLGADRSGARRLLTAADGHFGGLAAPASLDLDDRLRAPRSEADGD